MELVGNTVIVCPLTRNFLFFFFLSLDDLDGKLNNSDSAITVCIPNFYSNQLVLQM